MIYYNNDKGMEVINMTVEEINKQYKEAIESLDNRLIDSQTNLELEYQRERNLIVSFYEDMRRKAVESK